MRYSEYAGTYVQPAPSRPLTVSAIFFAIALVFAVTIAILFKTDVLHAVESYDADDLSGLYDGCAGGDMEACDSLFFEAEAGSEEEEFARTCGGMNEEAPGGTCAVDVDGMAELCTSGNLQACDDLYWISEPDSDYERLASECGGAGPSDGECVATFGDE